jgi:hypothetical protein
MAKKASRPSRRSQNQRAISEERRVRVSDLYRQGKAFYQIAKLLNVCVDTITEDMKAIRAEWRAQRLANMDEAVAEQLAKLDLTEREAWEAYRRSCKNAEIRKTTKDALGRTHESKELRGQAGDPRFLSIVQNAVKQRRELLGLDAPVKTEANVRTTVETQPPLSRDEVAERLRQKLQSISTPLTKD